jgi:disulfide bond formation protein DsbB
MHKRLVFLLVFLVLGMVLMGCGGDNGSDSDPAPVEENTAVNEPAETESESLVGDATAGKAQYDSVCIACHGADATGVVNLGKDLTTSEFVQGLSDDELVEFVKMGRSVSDPANTTGVDMPPKGGSPALSDQNIYDIVAYLRTLEK